MENIHLEFLQGATEGFDCFHVKMIRRLVKDEEIWTAHEQY